MPLNRWNFHLSSLKLLATLEGSLERLKDNPTSITDRTVINAAVQLTEPIEMLNDEKERFRYGSVHSILMIWMIPFDDGAPKESDRLVIEGTDLRIRKVKRWPAFGEAAFYELHIEDET